MSDIISGKTEVYSCDVLVVGAGAGGIPAGVAAAREGAEVIIADRNGFVGGMTASGLPYLGYLDAKRRQVVGGIAAEFVDELKKDGYALGIRYCPKHLSLVGVNPEGVKLTAARYLKENGVKILLHMTAVGVGLDDGKITSVTFDCAGKRIRITAKTVIDATGDGTVAYLAGAGFRIGRAGVDIQPPSVLFTIGGVDKEGLFRYLENHPEELEPYTLEYLRESPDYVLVTLHSLWRELVPKGEWPIGIWAMICINRPGDTEVCINGPRMAGTDATDPASITKAELEGAEQVSAFVKMLRKYVGGFENAFVSHINDSIGIRETRHINGIKTLTGADVKSGRITDDTIALGAYPIDIHGSGDSTSEFIHFDSPYGIPYLAAVSADIRGLMMSGRCISADREAFGSCRVMGTCFAVGEAVGIGAALAAKNNCLPEDVPVGEIRKILIRNGAVLSV